MSMLRVRTVLSGWPGGPGLATFYFAYQTTGSGAASAPDVVARVRAFWLACAALFPSSFSAQVQANVDDLDPTNGALVGSFAGGAPTAVAGSNGTQYNAFPAMLLLRENTGTIVAGRRVVGRSFIGPVAGSVDTNGSPTPANLTTLVSAATGMFTGSTTAVSVVWQRPKPTRPGAVWTISNFTAAPYFAILRSRRD